MKTFILYFQYGPSLVQTVHANCQSLIEAVKRERAKNPLARCVSFFWGHVQQSTQGVTYHA